MLSYFILIMGTLLLMSCIVIYWRMSIDFKRTIKCYANYLKDYKMQIPHSTYKRDDEILQITKKKYSLLSKSSLVFSIFSISLIIMGLMDIRNSDPIINHNLYTILRIVQLISLGLGAIYITNLNRIRNN